MISDEVAEKIAAAIRTAGGNLGGRMLAANLDTGELAGETFSAGSRVPLAHPWYLFEIRPTSAEAILSRFEAIR
jgi:hypothetical protein